MSNVRCCSASAPVSSAPEVTPVQASKNSTESRMSRTRLADVVTSALALDTSMEGRQRYARWQSPPAESNAAEMFWPKAPTSQGATHEYNPVDDRMTANSAGVNPRHRANTSSRFKDQRRYIYVRPCT